MAIGSIPPWLESKPKDFVDAASTGAALGIRRSGQVDDAAANQARIALESRRIAQDSMADQARIALAGKQLESAERQNALQAKVAEEQTQKKFLYETQRNAIADAYKTAVLGVAKTKVEDAAKQSAMVAAQKQGFARAIASGMSPAEAASKYPLAMTAGVAAQIAHRPAPQYDTISETIPAVPATPAHNEGGFFGIGGHPVPATPAVNKQVITRRVPQGSSPIPPTVAPPAPATPPGATAKILKFIRDSNGNLVPETP